MDKGHGRLETRTLTALETTHTGLLFPGIKQVGRLQRTRENLTTGVIENESIILITNCDVATLGVEQFAELKRNYWAIENKLHYRKDMVFGEDRSTIRARNGPANMASLVNFALGIMQVTGIVNIKRCVDNLRYQAPAQLHQALL
jgi:hypothetical protein